MANRRMLLKAIETVQAGGTAPGVADAAQAGADARARTRWTASRRPAPGRPGGSEQVQAKRAGAPWIAGAASRAPSSAA